MHILTTYFDFIARVTEEAHQYTLVVHIEAESESTTRITEAKMNN